MLESFKIPKGHYVRGIEIDRDKYQITFLPRKKVALTMIALSANYWHYAARAIEDCREKFLSDHNVDYFLWTDFCPTEVEKLRKEIQDVDGSSEEKLQKTIGLLGVRMRDLEKSYPELAQKATTTLKAAGMTLKGIGQQFQLECTREFKESDTDFLIQTHLDLFDEEMKTLKKALKGVRLIETDMAPPPMPTLMRYHLFLQEESLKDYEYIFYLDADMRVVDNILAEEICGEKLTCAKHPMYALAPRFNAPYESNPGSAAYISRLGEIKQTEEKTWFEPLYVAGGFQGGPAPLWIEAMKEMRDTIDKDLNNNYIARWNDESHWNRYLWEHRDTISIVLDPGYIYPDSLIKEYYEPIWGRSYTPKIITITKPTTLRQLTNEDRAALGTGGANPSYLTNCPTCGDKFTQPNIQSVVTCNGSGKPHEVMQRS